MPTEEYEQMLAEAAEYLATDPRYWFKNDGSFLYGEWVVYFQKVEDSIFLFVEGVMEIVPIH